MQVDVENGVIRVQFIGEYTGEALLQAYDRIAEHPYYDCSYNRLWDTRLATMPTVGALDVLKIIRGGVSKLPDGVKIAIRQQ